MRILIVDERRERAQALATRIEADSEMLLAGCLTSVAEAAEAAAQSDVLLLHQDADEAGRKLLRVLAVSHPHVRTLMVGVDEDEREAILPYLEVGAAGYVSRQELNGGGDGAEGDPLLTRVRAAYRQEALISPQVAALVMRRIAELARANGEALQLLSDPRALLS